MVSRPLKLIEKSRIEVSIFLVKCYVQCHLRSDYITSEDDHYKFYHAQMKCNFHILLHHLLLEYVFWSLFILQTNTIISLNIPFVQLPPYFFFLHQGSDSPLLRPSYNSLIQALLESKYQLKSLITLLERPCTESVKLHREGKELS